MDDIMTWEDLLNSGELEGFDSQYINSIDAEVAAEYPCSLCGGQCIGKGRRNPQGNYRCFSECQKCGNVFEF